MEYKIIWGEGYSQIVKSIAEAISIMKDLLKEYDSVKIIKI